MSYRSLVVAAGVAALSIMHIANAAAQSVYVAPGGIYVAPGAGPVYVTPGVPDNGAAAFVEPGPGYGPTAYVEPDYDYGYGTAAYVEPSYRYGYRPAAYAYGYAPRPYLEPRYGYGSGPRPYVEPRYGYGYGRAVPNRGYSGPRSAYASALPARPRVAVSYRTGRCIGRRCH